MPGDPRRLGDGHALFDRIAGGDESALAVVYDRWADRVHTLAFWILRDADEAEDVVEETFWQVWQTAKDYDARRAAGSTWLLMIARCRALDRLRRRRVSRRQQEAGSSADGGSDGTGVAALEPPGASVEQADCARALASALRELPLEQQQAVRMAFFEGMSHGEIAASSGLLLGTVKTRIRLALRKLRERVDFLDEARW